MSRDVEGDVTRVVKLMSRDVEVDGTSRRDADGKEVKRTDLRIENESINFVREFGRRCTS